MSNLTHEVRLTGAAASARARRARKIAELIDTAPPLTDDQVQRLRTLLHDHPRATPGGAV